MKLKASPEDFRVKEIMELDISEGDYSYFLLKKRGLNTLDVIGRLAESLGIEKGKIGVAGFKDRDAITEQVISLWKVNREKVESLSFAGIELKYLGNGSKRINLGSLKGNEFKIIVRELDEKKELENKEVLNLFDEQRFGKEGKNIEIGKSLLKKDLEKVFELLGYEIKDKQYVNFLRTLDRRMFRFYIGAYQSYLWNEVVKSLSKKYDEVEIYGFLTEFKEEVVEKKYKELLEKEGVKRGDFLMKYFPELAAEGGKRKMYMKAEKFKEMWFESDGKWNVELSFYLEKGCYATMFVKNLFS